MIRQRKPSASTQKVLLALMSKSQDLHYGYSLMKETGLKSGTLYPILMRLKERGFLKSEWETLNENGRPPRQHYELTPLGTSYVRNAVIPHISPVNKSPLTTKANLT